MLHRGLGLALKTGSGVSTDPRTFDWILSDIHSGFIKTFVVERLTEGHEISFNMHEMDPNQSKTSAIEIILEVLDLATKRELFQEIKEPNSQRYLNSYTVDFNNTRLHH